MREEGGSESVVKDRKNSTQTETFPKDVSHLKTVEKGGGDEMTNHADGKRRKQQSLAS